MICGGIYFGAYYILGPAVAIPPPPVVGTGGPAAARRRYELDVKPTKRQPIPEQKPRQRRIPEVHVALSLAAPSAVVVAEVAVVPLLPITMAVRLPWIATPALVVRGQVTSRLGLANEHIIELEAVLAAVLEDD